MELLDLVGQVSVSGFNMDNLADLIVPIMALLIPIVAIMASHQRKMAEIFAQRQSNVPNPEIQGLREEIGELKALVHQQAIMVDNLVSLPKRENLEERVKA